MQIPHALRFAAVFFFASVLTLSAQTPDTGVIRGTVLDSSRAAVPAAEVTVTNNRTGTKHVAHTDGSGNFAIAGLSIEGDYDVSAHKEGFALAETKGVTLIGGATANLNFQLAPAADKTEVTVTGAEGTIRTDLPQLGDHLDTLQIQETPLLNSRITYLPLLNAANRPAINQGDVFMNEDLFTTNGSGRRQTAWVVDGSTANDSWGRQTIFTNVPRDAVQEMTVLENAFSAEFGATTGGVVNMVTKSGGDAYHGDLFGVWRPSDLGAKLSGFTSTSATSGNQVVTDSLGQLGASFSGPVPHAEKTYFYFSGEYSREDRGSPVISPLDPGVFVGHYTDWMTFLRIDHQINEKNNLFFRANTDSFHDTNPNGTVGGNSLPTVDRIFQRRTYTAELGETAVLSSSLVNSAHIEFQLASPITEFTPVINGTQFVVPITAVGTFTSGTSQSALLMNPQYGVSDTLSKTMGRHQIKFGGDLSYSHTGGNSKEFGGPIYLGQLKYNTCTLTVEVCESSAFLDDIGNVASYTQS